MVIVSKKIYFFFLIGHKSCQATCWVFVHCFFVVIVRSPVCLSVPCSCCHHDREIVGKRTSDYGVVISCDYFCIETFYICTNGLLFIFIVPQFWSTFYSLFTQGSRAWRPLLEGFCVCLLHSFLGIHSQGILSDKLGDISFQKSFPGGSWSVGFFSWGNSCGESFFFCENRLDAKFLPVHRPPALFVGVRFQLNYSF